MRDFADVDAYLAACDRWPEEIRALRRVLLATGLDEQVKWGQPCYVHGEANIALVQEFTADLSLMFFKGVLLEDPDGVLEEVGPNSHAARRIMFRSVDDVEALADTVRAYVAEAVDAEEAGTPLPPRPDEELAPELAERLARDPELSIAFDELTPGRQREYNLHVSGAKRSSTRESRVERIVPRILAGKGMRDR